MKYKNAEKKLLCVPDAHTPYHDKRALNLVKKVCAAIKPDIIIVMGDWWDFWEVSFHEKTKNLRRAPFNVEFAEGLRHLTDFSAGRKCFVEGNHEVRLRRYFAQRTPEVAKYLETMGASSVKQAVERAGWQFTPYRRPMRIGKVLYSHDFDRAGKYAIHQNIADTQHSFVIGHTHRLDYAVEGDTIGTGKLGASFGWLGDFDTVDYRNQVRARREWAHGFGVGYMSGNGTTWWVPCPIIQGSTCVEGKVYRG